MIDPILSPWMGSIMGRALQHEEESMMTSNTVPTVSRRTALAGLGAGGLGLTLAARGAAAQDAELIAGF